MSRKVTTIKWVQSTSWGNMMTSSYPPLTRTLTRKPGGLGLHSSKKKKKHNMLFITVRKVMFLHLSVILFTGEYLPSACWDTHTPGQTPLVRQPPPGRHPPWVDSPPARHPPSRHPPAQCMLGYTPPAEWDTHGYCWGWYACYWNAFLFMK